MANRWLLIGIAITVVCVIALGLGLGLGLGLSSDDDEEIVIIPTLPAEPNRIDCAPEGANETYCRRHKGCLWSPSNSSGVPWCFLNSSSYGYRLVGRTRSEDQIYRIRLQHIDSGCSMFGGDVKDVVVDVMHVSDWLLRVKVYPLNEDNYEVPVKLNMPSGGSRRTSALYEVEFNTSIVTPFSMRIMRKATGTVIWDTSIGGLTVAKQFLQITTRLPSKRLYGFGENVRSTFQRSFDYVTVPMFARDQPPSPGANLYGVHPYYMLVEDLKGNSHGVMLLNSNAMEVAFQPTPAITYRTTGGILDFYFVVSDSPESVTSLYTQLVGRPYLPPYWSLGFQLSRYGYNNLTNLQTAVNRTLSAGIPLDVMYGDIDHFNDSRDFTYDKVNFPGLPSYVRHLQDNGMRFIIVLDPAIIGVDPDYEPFVSGKDQDVFIRWAPGTVTTDIERFNSTLLYGYVWPTGEAVFPDYFNPAANTWWKKCIVDYHSELPFDGLWLDMNEPANFGTNLDKPFNWPENRTPWSLKCPHSGLDDPPYKPKSIWGPRLSDKTICMVAQHNTSNVTYSHYDVHNLYGSMQIIPTLQAVRQATRERSLVISRSTFVDSGQHCGHWLGDNASIWPHLHESIIGLLDFNLFGIPYIGADICGFFDPATGELCQRWTQLGAFYTFSRNHNGNSKDQDPASFDEHVTKSSRFIIRLRYSLLPFLYTLFYHAHVEGSTVIRPLFHEFVSDDTAYSVDRQFLWGPCLLISPVLDEGKTSVRAYLPTARWFDFYTGTEEQLTGQFVELDAPREKIPLHLRGGYIVVTQAPATNTNYSRLNNFSLIVSPDEANHAIGQLFWDDGVSEDTIAEKNYLLVEYTFSQQISPEGNYTLTSKLSEGSGYQGTVPPPIEAIKFMGYNGELPRRVTFNETTDLTFSPNYDNVTKVLLLNDLQLPVSSWTLTMVVV